MPSLKWPDGANISQREFYYDWEYEWGVVNYDGTIDVCDCCGRFFIQSAWDRSFCHKLPVIFTDGSCLNNGTGNARAGFGVAVGENPHDKWSYSFTGPGERTSQKAELLAVTQGIAQAAQAISQKPKKHCWSQQKTNKAFVIATDSNNAVQGVINNLPEWKVGFYEYRPMALTISNTFRKQANGFLNTKGYPICDEAEFRQLDATITKYENLGWSIGLWYVPREYNREADELAGNGARADEGPPRQTFVNTYQVVEYYAEN